MFTRLHTQDDLPELFCMAERALSEGWYSRYPVNGDKFQQLARMAEVEPDMFCVVAEAAGVIRGFLLGVVMGHHFVELRYASDIAFYVLPEFRGRAVGAAIVREYEHQARLRRAQQALLGATYGIEPMRTLEFYNSLGYETIGGLTAKDLGESHVG